MDVEYDVIVLGTGLKECILSAVLSVGGLERKITKWNHSGDKVPIAVKQVHNSKSQAPAGPLSKAAAPTFLGHCLDNGAKPESSGNKFYLFYEYVPHGNLRDHLSDNGKRIVLTWTERLPILRIFEPILTNARQELFHGAHTRSISISTPLTGGIMKFAKILPNCMGCKAVIRGSNKPVCSDCKGREAELYCKTRANVSEIETLFGKWWSQCLECQGSLHQDVLCTSNDCPIFHRRKKAEKDMSEAKVQLDRWDF